MTYDEKAAAAELHRRRYLEQLTSLEWSHDRWEPRPIIAPKNVTRALPARIQNLLYDGKRHMVFAEPETSKTLIACMLSLEYVRNTPTDPAERWLANVAYIDFENGLEAISLMLAELGATAEEVARIHHFGPTTAPTERDVYNINAELECGLVIVDAGIGATNASGIDGDNDRTDIEKMAQQWIDPFWESGSATILLEHMAKTNDGKWPIGSERKMGSCDTAYHIDAVTTVSRGTHGLYKIIARRDRGGYHRRGTTVSEMVVESDPDTHHMSWEFRTPAATASSATGFRPTNLMERLSRQLELHPEGLTRSKLYKATQGKRQWLVTGLELLIAEGYIEDNGSLLRSLAPFREDDAGSPVPMRFPPVPTEPRDPGSPGSPAYQAGTGNQNGNGHINLTPDERDSLIEDASTVDHDQLERIRRDHADIAEGRAT